MAAECTLASGEVLGESELQAFERFSQESECGSVSYSPEGGGFVCSTPTQGTTPPEKTTTTEASVGAGPDLCTQAAQETQSMCMAENDSGMNQVMQSANMLGRQLGMVSSADISSACSAIGNLSQAANGALAVFKGNCLRVVNNCESACKSSTLPSAASNLRACQQASQKAQGLDTDMLLMMYTANNAKKCKELTSNPWNELCKKNPSLAGCSTSTKTCSDPTYASTSLICVCQANPNDPRCTSYVNNGGGGGVDTGGGGGGSSSGGPGNDSLALGGDDMTPPLGQGGGSGMGEGAGRPNGGGGFSPSGGSGASGKAQANKGQAGGAAGSGANTKILNGYYSGGAAGGAGSGSGNGSNPNAGNGKFGSNNLQNKVDLKQFLPGGKFDPRRGLAGISGPDGITGPSSDLFAKVNIRYRAVLHSMRP